MRSGRRQNAYADISFGVIHSRAKRPRTAKRSEVVNNSAPGQNSLGEGPASARTRSCIRDLRKIKGRLPVEPEAPAPTSNRTTPQEGCNISAMDSRAKGEGKVEPAKKMKSGEQSSEAWLLQRAFGGLDWASQKHNVVVVDAGGKILEKFEIQHSASGWQQLRQRLEPYGSIPIAIETNQGLAVEQLIQAAMVVYPVNPKSAKGYRERKAPSGVKDDWLDAWSLADACRLDGLNWKALRPEDSLIKELRLLCRDEVGLIEQRTSFINQLRHALAEYYPTALESFEDWGSVSAWMFVQRFPTPQALEAAGKRQWQKFLHSRHLWRSESGPRRMELFAQATQMYGSTPVANAKSQLALSLISMLFALEKQLRIYRQRIEELFARHPDHDLFGSLPGAGPKIAPRLMSEIGDDRARFDKGAEALQCFAGTAPVTVRTGKAKTKTNPQRWPCHQRWASNTHLRHALHLFAEHTLSRCVWAQIYYRHHRDKGRTHSDCLRRLAQRWVKIIYRMWMDRTPYDPMLHNQNQLKHGSWVLQLNPQK
jgi:transposase